MLHPFPLNLEIQPNLATLAAPSRAGAFMHVQSRFTAVSLVRAGLGVVLGLVPMAFLTCLAFLTSCVPSNYSAANFPGRGGNLSSISIGLPDTSNMAPAQRNLLNGFRLLIEPLDQNCPRGSQLRTCKDEAGEPLRLVHRPPK